MSVGRVPKPQLIDKETRVVEMRREGCGWDEIAAAVGYSDPNSAYHAYNRAMKRAIRTAGADEMRSLEGERLDKMQRAVWMKACDGDLPSVHTVLRIMERRAKLFGLDAPVQVGVTVNHLDPATIDLEVARLAAMLKANSKQQDETDIEDAEIVDQEGGGGRIEISNSTDKYANIDLSPKSLTPSALPPTFQSDADVE